MQINQLLTPYNYNSSSISRIKYIVIHYVGALGGAKACCEYYASCYVGASAHYYVGFSGEIWQSVRDQDIAWSVGASSYTHPECRNSNSISIEMCVRKKSTNTMNATDRDWYFEDATVKNAIELTKYLMKKYNVPASNVIRHYDVTGKICPNPYVYNNTKYTWSDFKKAISNGSVQEFDTPSSSFESTGEATCTGQDVRVRQVANGPIMEYLDKNDKLLVDGKTDGSWTHVKVQKTGTVGWVSTQYVSITKNTTTSNKKVTYRVGTNWKNGKCVNQHNAFQDLNNAKADADTAMNSKKTTYYVFDESGKSVYTAKYTEPAKEEPVLQHQPSSTSGPSQLVKDAQIHINNFSNSNVPLTGVYDDATRKGLIKCLKIALNHDYNAGLIINTSAGVAVKNAIGKRYVTANGEVKYLCTVVQIALMARGYEHDGVKCPGEITTKQLEVIRKYQKDHDLTVDGLVGYNTLKALIKQ